MVISRSPGPEPPDLYYFTFPVPMKVVWPWNSGQALSPDLRKAPVCVSPPAVLKKLEYLIRDPKKTQNDCSTKSAGLTSLSYDGITSFALLSFSFLFNELTLWVAVTFSFFLVQIYLNMQSILPLFCTLVTWLLI